VKDFILRRISGSHGGDNEKADSGLYSRVIWYKFTDFSEVLAASIIRMAHSPDDGGSKYL
jgi:hypothetical protein